MRSVEIAVKAIKGAVGVGQQVEHHGTRQLGLIKGKQMARRITKEALDASLRALPHVSARTLEQTFFEVRVGRAAGQHAYKSLVNPGRDMGKMNGKKVMGEFVAEDLRHLSPLRSAVNGHYIRFRDFETGSLAAAKGGVSAAHVSAEIQAPSKVMDPEHPSRGWWGTEGGGQFLQIGFRCPGEDFRIRGVQRSVQKKMVGRVGETGRPHCTGGKQGKEKDEKRKEPLKDDCPFWHPLPFKSTGNAFSTPVHHEEETYIMMRGVHQTTVS